MGFANRRDLRATTAWVFEDDEDTVADLNWFTTDPSAWSGVTARNTRYVCFDPIYAQPYAGGLYVDSHSFYFNRPNERQHGVINLIVAAAEGRNIPGDRRLGTCK